VKREGWVPPWVLEKKAFLPVEKRGVAEVAKAAMGGPA
jgi:hypothetical protein